MVIAIDLHDFTGGPTFVLEIVPLKCSICTNGLIQSKVYKLYYIFLPNIKRISLELSVIDRIPAF
jgi:hypothetical protein